MFDNLVADSRDSGMTVRVSDGYRPSYGWAVSLDSTEYGEVIADNVFFSDNGDALAAFVADRAEYLYSGGLYLGVWHEAECGRVHLDLSVVLNSESAALDLARESGQISIYCLHTGETIYLAY